MLSKEEIEKYKDYPDGSGGKMLFDKKNLTTSEFFEKYYSKPDLSDWNYWMKTTIDNAWAIEKRKEFLSRWGERMKFFDFDKMERFYREEKLSVFDEDIRKFIAFLSGDGFFENYKITFKNWIKSRTFINPSKNYEQDVTIEEALKLKGGMNYIRKQLINLHWWRL